MKEYKQWLPIAIVLAILGLLAVFQGFGALLGYIHREGLDASGIVALIGLGLLGVYLLNHTRRWPIFPSGILFTIAVVTALPYWVGWTGLILLGIGGSFAMLALLPGATPLALWSLAPAALFGVLGILALAAHVFFWALSLMWPAVFIIVGLVLVWLWVRARNHSDSDPDSYRTYDSPPGSWRRS